MFAHAHTAHIVSFTLMQTYCTGYSRRKKTFIRRRFAELDAFVIEFLPTESLLGRGCVETALLPDDATGHLLCSVLISSAYISSHLPRTRERDRRNPLEWRAARHVCKEC